MKRFAAFIVALALNPLLARSQGLDENPIVEVVLREAAIQNNLPEILKAAAWSEADDFHPFYLENIEKIFAQAKMPMPFTANELHARYRDDKLRPFDVDERAVIARQFYGAIKASLLEEAKTRSNVFLFYYDYTLGSGRDRVQTTHFLFRNELPIPHILASHWLDLRGRRFPDLSLATVTTHPDLHYSSCWILSNTAIRYAGPSLSAIFDTRRVQTWSAPLGKGRRQLGVHDDGLACTPISRADGGRFYIDADSLSAE